MKRHGWKLGAIAILAAAVLVAFSGPGHAKDFKWPKVLTIATPAMGSTSYNIDLAWANKLEEGTGMKVRLLPEESTSAKWANVKSGRFDMIQDTFGYIAGWMMEGREGFHTEKGGPFQSRFFWMNQDMCFTVFVRGDSPVKTIYDIPKMGKNFRVIHWTVPAGIDIVKAVLAWVNLTPDDVTLVQTGSYIGATRMIAEGKADMSCFGIPSAPVFMESHANPHGLRILSLDPENNPEGAKRFRQYMAAYYFPKVAGGPEEFQGQTGWGTPAGFICREDMDDDLTYHMAKWTVENFDQLKDLHPFLKYYMNIEANKRAIDEGYFPVHEGVVRFLKEKGVWTEANERRQAYSLKLFDKYTKGYEKAISMAKKKKIPIDPSNQEWTDLWENYKKENGIPKILVLSDAEIETALKEMK